MNKDTLVASVLGLGLGLIAAIALWVVPRILPKNTSSPATDSEIVAEDAKKEETPNEISQSFSITAPVDGAIVTDSAVTIEGVAKDSQLVIITSNNDQQIVKPTAESKFSSKFTLKDGGNEIVVTRLGTDPATEESKRVSVFLTDEEI